MPPPHLFRSPLHHGLAALALLASSSLAQMTPLGQFPLNQDVGDPAIAGSATYDAETQTYRLRGAGINLWSNRDEFRFAGQKLSGDFIVRATIEFVGEGTDPHRKIGIIAREALTTDARYADACVHGDTLSSLQFRAETGGETDQVILDSHHPTEIALERKGDTFIFSAARFGEPYKSIAKVLDLADELYVGLFLCAHREDVVEEAIFTNVRVVRPAPDDLVQYRDYLGSHLEVMDVTTGHRRILHSENRSLQAPNWTPDGRFLIYNAEGLLYRYELATGKPSILNTGFADENNNDHVLSFDGSMLGISHHVGADRTSVIYTLPVGGSDTPRRITDPARGHSFFHGWSPDARKLIFTGQRNEQWDIWSIDLETLEETALTDNPTLDDGSEYSPDGEWIYFNSVRTGTMQIWRMRPDGRGQEQVTFDSNNNWFPHFSPDGKWIVYLAFPGEMDPTTHPFYKRCYLRLMPAAGGVPRTIAYLYGGQGTINVPSWSPDSRHLAFVTNTLMD